MKQGKAPNFLVITTDQQKADHLGCYGNPEIMTPHIDSLSQQGRRFEKFYVASGVCMSNRASLMTGRYPSAHGVRCNGIPLSRNAVTFVDLLRDAGYSTVLVGKCHLQNMTDMAPETPFSYPTGNLQQPSGAIAAAVNFGLDGSEYDSESRSKWRTDKNHRIDTPYYGFDNVRLCSYHGDLVEAEYYRWLCQQVDNPDALRGRENALAVPQHKLSQAYKTRVPENLYSTTWIADRAADELAACAETERPFFMQCSFTDPHHPFTPPGRYWEMYDPCKVTLPSSFFTNDKNAAFAPVMNLIQERATGSARINSTVAYAATEDEVRQAIALTYGMISMIDDAVGRILLRLEELKLAEDTIIVFMSDHGDFMGDHGLLLKSALHYSSLIRIPFIWSEPGMAHPGVPTQGLQSTIDIAATILERAGIAPYVGYQGESFIGLLHDPGGPGKDAILIEEDGHAPTFGLSRPVRLRTVVTRDLRLSIYDLQGWGELYDLANDPDELENLYNRKDCGELRAQAYEHLAHALMMADDTLPLPTRRA